MNFENFGEVTADESGVHFETGVPVQFRFLHNTESSPYFGAQFQQDIEPGGYYVVHDTMGNGPQVPGWEGGVATADYPLVIVHNTKEEVGYDENSWKARLWEEFGQPSSADRFRDRVRRLGYDAIVTVRLGTQETMEIVLLDPERQIRRGAVAGPPILPNGPPLDEIDPELWLLVHGVPDVEFWSSLFAQDPAPPENVLRHTFAQVLGFPTDDIEDTFGHANNFIDWYYTIVGLYDRHSRGAIPKRSITKAFAQWQDELTSRVDEAGIGSFMSTLLAVAGAQAALPPKLKKWLHRPDPSQGSAFFIDYSPRGRDQEYRLVVPYGPGDATSNYTTLLLYAALDAAAFYPKDLGLPSDAPAELHRFIGEGTVPKHQNPRKVGFPEGTKGYVADFAFGELVARMRSYVYGDADA